VAYKTYPGQFHGFITMGKILPKANTALHEMGEWLKGLG
jgi:acetyl esterase